MATLTTSWQKIAEVSNTVTSNTTAWMGLYMKYARYTTYDRVYFEIRYWATNPYGNYFAWSQDGTMNWSFSYKGQSKSGSFSSISITANQTPVTKASGYVDIYHTTAVSESASITGILYKASKSCSGTAGLTTIASKSTVSVSSEPYLSTENSGSAVTISCSNTITTNMSHTIRIKNPDTGNVIETISPVGTSTPWKPLLFDQNDQPTTYTTLITGESKNFDVECETFYNNTTLGTDTCTIKVHVPDQENTKPTMISGSEFNISEEGSSIPEAWKEHIYIQSKSKLSFYVRARTKAASEMGSATVNIDGSSYRNVSSNGYDTTIGMTKTIQTAGSMPIKINVSDSRGFRWYDTDNTADWYTIQTINVTKYITPSFDGEPQISRVNSNGNPDDLGTYLAFSMKARISALTVTENNTDTHYNTPTFKVKWKQKSASTWNETTYTGTLDTTNDDWVVNIANQKLQHNGSDVTISASSAYDIRFELIDQFNDSSHPVSSAADINVGGDLLNFNVNGHAMAIGQLSTASQNEEKLEVAYPTTFKTMPKINGVSLLDVFYPVGSYYETSNTSFNPNTSWGGTWVEDTYGRVTVAYQSDNADFDTVGEVGGSTTVTLQLSQIPEHCHGKDGGTTTDSGGAHNHTGRFKEQKYPNSGGSRDFCRKWGADAPDTTGNVFSGSDGKHTHTLTKQGGGQAHNNLQPYIVVKRWHRTA